MYSEGFRLLTGEFPRVIEIVVESRAPHDTVVYDVGLEVLEPGRALLRTALDRLAQCGDCDEWPGQGEGKIQSMMLTPWAMGTVSDESVALDMSGIEVNGEEG
jgi:hypothetical protein